MDGSVVDFETSAIKALVEKQKAAFIAEGEVTAAVRIDRMKRAKAILVDNADLIAKTVSEDFGHRSEDTTMLADVVASVSGFNHAIKHVKQWMKAEKRSLEFPMGLLGARGEVQYQPKGVVGIVAPWNFPIGMMFVPLSNALSAGNRAIIKPSEHTPRTSNLIAALIAANFDESEVSVVTGGPSVGAAFVSQPFDHIIFTGPTSVGKLVMAAAAENLTPVTLELGGKSPVFVSDSADLKMVSERVGLGKFMNAGQICLAPDYLMISEDRVEDFVSTFTQTVSAMYPTMLDNDDYTSIITPLHRERLLNWLNDAREKGADVRLINPSNENFEDQTNTNKMPGALILNPTDDMKVMQDEIFGPILPVLTYKTLDEVIARINKGDRPLAAYYFGRDRAEENAFIRGTTSGSAMVNDVIWQGGQDSMPFGGVGASGMGNYHGVDGFKTFSHARSVLRFSKINIMKLVGFLPPYGKTIKNTIKMKLK